MTVSTDTAGGATLGDTRRLVLDGSSLGVKELTALARDPRRRIEIDPAARERVAAGRREIEAIVERYERGYAELGGKSALELVQEYGVTTGFGEFKDIPVPPDQLERLQRNLLLSHAVGVGDSADADDRASYFPADVVRAALIIRLNAFLKGHSGVRVEILDILRRMIHAGIVPLVPIRGSLGASGDLCPLAHLFSILLGQGRFYRVRVPEDIGTWPGRGALRPASELPPLLGLESELEPSYKEGLALSNGATFSAALLALAVHDAELLASTADVAAALTLEALCGCARAFDPRVHEARGQSGQIDSAANVRALVDGSRLVDKAAAAVQDPYSLRCAPAVHGASRDVIAYAHMVVARELNAATDNPLFFPRNGHREPPWDLRFRDNWLAPYNGDERGSYSAGNFHGEPLALAADALTMAVAELANISERRVQMLLDDHHSRNLPANLVARRGVQSGFMIAQYSAASLVNENKVLAHPASVDSIPSAANIEDHVSMAATAGRKLRTVLGNVEAALAIELLVAAQAADWRAGLGYPPLVARTSPPAERPVAADAGWEAIEEEAGRFAAATAEDRRSAIVDQLGTGTGAAYREIRATAAPLVADRSLAEEIRALRGRVHDGSLVRRVESALGELLRPVKPLG